jgi:GNAT superfamily N-acetyltransferase
MTSDVSISVAKRNEAGALVALRTAVAQGMTEQFGVGHWSARPGKAEVVRQLRASQVLVARRDGEIIGTVRLMRASFPAAVDTRAFTPVAEAFYAFGLAVAPHCRGAGIGRRLMEAAKQAARTRGAQALWLDAYEHRAGAGDFYVKCGFRMVGRTNLGDVPLLWFEWLTAG